jgi:hypothetical protein
VNGAYGGNIGLASVTLSSNTVELLYPVSKDYDLPHLIDPKGFVSGRLLFVRRRPAATGYYMADEYDCELLEVGQPPTVLYSWGRRKMTDARDLAFAQGEDGKPWVYDEGWHPVGEGHVKQNNTGSAANQSAGTPSPNGIFLAVAADSHLTVHELQSGAVRRECDVAGPVQDIAWSQDSRHLAVIVTNYSDREEEIFDFDEVLVPPGWPDFVFAFHDCEEIGPRMLARIARHTGLRPGDL